MAILKMRIKIIVKSGKLDVSWKRIRRLALFSDDMRMCQPHSPLDADILSIVRCCNESGLSDQTQLGVSSNVLPETLNSIHTQGLTGC